MSKNENGHGIIVKNGKLCEGKCLSENFEQIWIGLNSFQQTKSEHDHWILIIFEKKICPFGQIFGTKSTTSEEFICSITCML